MKEGAPGKSMFSGLRNLRCPRQAFEAGIFDVGPRLYG